MKGLYPSSEMARVRWQGASVAQCGPGSTQGENYRWAIKAIKA